ncbi:protein-disulfide reductase DsbD family protein [Altererythrobacter xiamenensis]|nr:protein-disulfide reductase DsbD domain-containing protein [Altererythrobacter xiamenensis]
MRASIIRTLASFLLLFSMTLSVPAHTQPSGLPESKMDRGTAQLAVEGSAVPGGTVMVALDFEPVEGWHGYWSNPGDAGQGIRLDWQLPQGWSAGEPQFPVPHTLLISGLMNHVFEGEHAVLVPIDVPEDAVAGRSYPIAVRGEWLTCSDTLCVPQWGTLRGEVRVSEQPQTSDPRFAGWRASIPPELDSPATFELTEKALRLAIPIPASMSLDTPHVFIENTGLVAYAEPQVFRRNGDLLTVDIPRKGDANPEEMTGILALGGDNGVRFEAERGDVPTGGTLIAGAEAPAGTPPIWTLLLGALAGGLILNIMPCVFPILSLKAISLARAGESEAQARREGIAYTAGVVLACVALGAVMLALRAAGEQVGWAFQLQNPAVVVVLLFLAVAITANFAGLFELPSISITRSGEPASAFATGLLAAFAATPCTGPFMAAALGAALLLPPAPALLLFAALGLGLALPFLLIGFIPRLRAMLPRPGAWMERFRRIMAIPMGLTALALVWLVARLGGQGFALMAMVVIIGLVLAFAVTGRLQRAGKMAWPAFALVLAPFALFGAFALPSAYAERATEAAQSILDPRPFSEAALADARASGQPVFLWFTADWCVTCKVNESVAIERETTKAAFEEAGVIAMVGDWTRPDPEITTFLNAQGAAGVPLYLWYEPGEAPEQLPQVLTPQMLEDRARR